MDDTRTRREKKLRSNLVPPPVILAMNRVAMFEHVAAFPCVRPCRRKEDSPYVGVFEYRFRDRSIPTLTDYFMGGGIG